MGGDGGGARYPSQGIFNPTSVPDRPCDDMLLRQIKKQRTSGPVNAHLTPGTGIYFNAFIHVYSPRAGADNPLGTNVDVNRKPLSLCPFVFKQYFIYKAV